MPRGARRREAEAGDVHYPGTYLAGGYNRLRTEIAGRAVENEDLVNLPNWLPVTFRHDEDDQPWFTLQAVEVLACRQELDLRRGLLSRTVRFRDKRGRESTLSQRRLVHMDHKHLAALETTLTPASWSGRVRFRAALDGRVVNAGVARYRSLNSKHLVPVEADAGPAGSLFLKVRTIQSGLTVAQAARIRVYQDGEAVETAPRPLHEPGYVAEEWVAEAERGVAIRVEKVVALFTSRDRAISECGLEARQAIARAGTFGELLGSHVMAWEALWRRFDIEVQHARGEAGERMSRVLHLHVFHLLQTVSPHTMDLDVGVPARGWHGEAYRGHIFWDELFILPFITFRLPEITRSLLMYRHRRLPRGAAAGA